MTNYLKQSTSKKNKNQCVGKQLAALGYNKYRLKINNRQA
jgi:hypothetical protein